MRARPNDEAWASSCASSDTARRWRREATAFVHDIAISDIARALKITRQSAGSLVRDAAQAGRIELLTNLYDRRIVQVELTSVGRSVLASKRAHEAAWIVGLLNGLESRELRTTARVLRVMRQRLMRDERERGPER